MKYLLIILIFFAKYNVYSQNLTSLYLGGSGVDVTIVADYGWEGLNGNEGTITFRAGLTSLPFDSSVIYSTITTNIDSSVSITAYNFQENSYYNVWIILTSGTGNDTLTGVALTEYLLVGGVALILYEDSITYYNYGIDSIQIKSKLFSGFVPMNVWKQYDSYPVFGSPVTYKPFIYDGDGYTTITYTKLPLGTSQLRMFGENIGGWNISNTIEVHVGFADNIEELESRRVIFKVYNLLGNLLYFTNDLSSINITNQILIWQAFDSFSYKLIGSGKYLSP